MASVSIETVQVLPAFISLPQLELPQHEAAFSQGEPDDGKRFDHAAPHLAVTPLELGSPEALTRLRLIAAFWAGWPEDTRRLWLNSQEIAVRPRALTEHDVAILPGGAIALRGPDEILVCDPSEAIALSGTEARALFNALRRRVDARHLLHTEDGIAQVERLPRVPTPHAVSIVQEAIRLPGRLTLPGPVLVHWCHKGAVAWPMAEAPAPLALAASIAGTPVSRGGTAIATADWHAEDAEARCRLLRPCIARHVTRVLRDEVPDSLLLPIIEVCVSGGDSLTNRTAAALGMLPACFDADAAASFGGSRIGWDRAEGYLYSAAQSCVLLGLEDVPNAVAALRAVRGVMEQFDVLVIAEDGDAPHSGPVSLWDDTALFLGRRLQPGDRFGLIIPVPATPVDFYALASKLAEDLGGVVTAHAPCWGFCHRLGPDGMEAGNAAWFGMGAGLDEVDVLIGDIGLTA